MSETDDEEDSVPISKTLRPKARIIPTFKGIKKMSQREADECASHGEVLRWSSDSEGDEVPISQTIGKDISQSDIWQPSTKTKALLAEAEKKAMAVAEKTAMVELDQALLVDVQAIPDGQEAVGVAIARDFGKDLGVFRGEVKHVRGQRNRHVYYVQYEDGDSEDFDLQEYQFAFEVRKALDAGKFRRDDSEGGNDDRISCDGTEDEWNDTENESDSDDKTTSRPKQHTKNAAI